MIAHNIVNGQPSIRNTLLKSFIRVKFSRPAVIGYVAQRNTKQYLRIGRCRMVIPIFLQRFEKSILLHRIVIVSEVNIGN